VVELGEFGCGWWVVNWWVGGLDWVNLVVVGG
jgi:hypothetical protein